MMVMMMVMVMMMMMMMMMMSVGRHASLFQCHLIGSVSFPVPASR